MRGTDSQDNDSTQPEQWEVVSKEDMLLVGHQHVWRLVRLRSRAGQLASGFQCIECQFIERVRDNELFGHGRIHYRGKS